MKEKKIEKLIHGSFDMLQDQERVHGLEVESPIFTNLTQDHFDFHKSMIPTISRLKNK